MAVDRLAPGVAAQVDTQRYHFIDYVMQAYLGAVGLIVLLFHGNLIDGWPWLVAAHAAGMFGVHSLIRTHAARPSARVLGFLRVFYPLIAVTLLYRETGLVNPLITGTYHDGLFVALEDWIFGLQPVVRFMETFPSRFFAELFYLAYFSYYLLIPAVGIALYIRVREQVFHYVSVVSFVFYVCYLAFIVFPVLGPTAIQLPGYAELVGFAYVIPPVPPSVESAVFYKVMTVIHGNYQVIGAAFPSSHVAVSAVAAYFSWRYLRRVRYLIAIDVLLLTLATVYCRYHYAVDAMGGLITAAILIPIGEWLYRRSL
jgi:membrane-associated phospholipid phosphatase